MTLRTRRPSGEVPPPVVLLEGQEKAGKTWAALRLSASERVGKTYVIDLGEGTADEYGSIPGVDYEVVEHDGTYAQILQAVVDVKAEAERAHKAGEPPAVLVVDSMTDEWNGLKNWASERAMSSNRNKQALARDPNAEVQITMNLWNDATARHRKLMAPLTTFPGIVVLTARGDETAKVEDGRPVEGARTWKVDAQKSLGFDVTLWIRMTRKGLPLIVGARSVHAGIRPGQDDAQHVTEGHEDDLLDWLIFDVLKYDPKTATSRTVQNLTGGDLSDEERADDTSKVERGRPAEDAWAGTPVRRPPATTDEAWLVKWDERLGDAQSQDDLESLRKDMAAQHGKGQITTEDRDAAVRRWTVVKADIEANTGTPLPLDGAA